MRDTRFAAFLAVGLLVSATSPVAHHGAASFDTTKELTLKGSVTEWNLGQSPLFPEVRCQRRQRHGPQLGGRSQQSHRHDQARLGPHVVQTG